MLQGGVPTDAGVRAEAEAAQAAPHTKRQIRKARSIQANYGLPDAYAKGILQRTCSDTYLVPDQRATARQMGSVTATLSYRKKRME